MPKTCTLPETNIRVAPENRPKRPKRKRESLPNIHFQGAFAVSFGEGIASFIPGSRYLPYFQPKMTSPIKRRNPYLDSRAITSRVVSRSFRPSYHGHQIDVIERKGFFDEETTQRTILKAKCQKHVEKPWVLRLHMQGHLEPSIIIIAKKDQTINAMSNVSLRQILVMFLYYMFLLQS